MGKWNVAWTGTSTGATPSAKGKRVLMNFDDSRREPAFIATFRVELADFESSTMSADEYAHPVHSGRRMKPGDAMLAFWVKCRWR